VSEPRSIYAAKLRDEFPSLACADHAAFARRGAWHNHFRERMGSAFNGRLVFEIGCNDAGLLARVAARHPDVAFVGLDWKCKAIYDAATRVSEMRLRNVALIRGRAQNVGRLFGPGEVDEVWVFHPDPCDKPAELKNRLIAEPFLADVHAVLRDSDSTLTLKTDHPGYYQWTLALLGLPEPALLETARSGAAGAPRVRARDLMQADALPPASPIVRRLFQPAATSADFWNDPVAQRHAAGRIFAGETTAFEVRFVRKRMPIYFLELRKR
jgi:tRNA (guanine-N7-)-methyltransferase